MKKYTITYYSLHGERKTLQGFPSKSEEDVQSFFKNATILEIKEERETPKYKNNVIFVDFKNRQKYERSN